MALPTVTPCDGVEAQHRQRPLDRRALGIGDTGTQANLDQHREPHPGHCVSSAALAPGQSAKSSPVMRSYPSR